MYMYVFSKLKHIERVVRQPLGEKFNVLWEWYWYNFIYIWGV